MSTVSNIPGISPLPTIISNPHHTNINPNNINTNANANSNSNSNPNSGSAAPPPSSYNINGHLKLTSRRIQDLVKSISPSDSLDGEVEGLLLELADDFVENLCAFSCAIAKHRKSNTLEVKDIDLHLRKNWDMKIPGFNINYDNTSTNQPNTEQKTGAANIPNTAESLLQSIKPINIRRSTISEGHKRRLAMVQKFKNQQYDKYKQQQLQQQQQQAQNEQDQQNEFESKENDGDVTITDNTNTDNNNNANANSNSNDNNAVSTNASAAATNKRKRDEPIT